jgi:hypothetical protein
MMAKQRLHQLVDLLPDDEVVTAARVLEALAGLGPGEPFYTSETAPLGPEASKDEPEGEAERSAVAEALAEVERGDGRPIQAEVLYRKFGL